MSGRAAPKLIPTTRAQRNVIALVRAAGWRGTIYWMDRRDGGWDVRCGDAELRVTRTRVAQQGVYFGVRPWRRMAT